MIGISRRSLSATRQIVVFVSLGFIVMFNLHHLRFLNRGFGFPARNSKSHGDLHAAGGESRVTPPSSTWQRSIVNSTSEIERDEVKVSETTASKTVLNEAGKKAELRATKERTTVWRELKRVTEQLIAHNVTIYVRAGTWLAAYRQAGYTPFDRDNDFGILDSDVPRAKNLPRLLPFPYKFVWSPGKFHLEPFVEGWPLMDGIIYQTNQSEQVAYDRKIAAFALKDLINFEELKFYDGFLRAPANSPKYLKQMYGSQCLEVQINKCARDKGDMFLTNPKKCNFPCYRGALDFPHMVRVNFRRGEILEQLRD